jgi:hypothetical protein
MLVLSPIVNIERAQLQYQIALVLSISNDCIKTQPWKGSSHSRTKYRSTTHNYIGHRPGTIDEETFNHAIGSRTTTEREIVPISTDIAA